MWRGRTLNYAHTTRSLTKQVITMPGWLYWLTMEEWQRPDSLESLQSRHQGFPGRLRPCSYSLLRCAGTSLRTSAVTQAKSALQHSSCIQRQLPKLQSILRRALKQKSWQSPSAPGMRKNVGAGTNVSATELAACIRRLGGWLQVCTLQGLHDWALHMRTTMRSSALSNSPFSWAGECTCTRPRPTGHAQAHR